MSIKTVRTGIILIVLAGFLVGCAGKSRSIPTNVNNLYIRNFNNNTSEPGLEGILTEDVTQEFLSNGQVNLVDREDADAILLGTIKRYKHIPLIFNDQDIVQQYKVRIEISLALKDAQSGDVLWTHSTIWRETTYSDIQVPIETELDAQERVSEQLARDVVSSTVEGWPYMGDV